MCALQRQITGRRGKELGADWAVDKMKRSATKDAANDTSVMLSSRGKQALSPILPYLTSYFECLNNPCHPVTNPQGHIALCVAENKLAQKYLADRLSRPSVAKCAFETFDSYNYGDLRGLPHVCEAVARFLERFFWKSQNSPNKSVNKEDSPSVSISPDHICLAPGASSILGHLFYSLAEAGDAILIPAPYYAAFENDMKAIAKCVPIPVYMNDCTQGPTKEELEMAARKAETQGYTVKMLLITNPNNPLGVIYKPSVVLNAIEWARARSMHTVMDEIYGLSVHDVSSEECCRSIAGAPLYCFVGCLSLPKSPVFPRFPLS